MNNMRQNLLITGSSSGLGRHCLEYLGGVGLTRQTDFNAIKERAEKEPYDAIVHCAFNTRPEVSTTDLYQYLQDTTFLTNKLVRLPHRKFIFISSVDVYPKDGQSHNEDEILYSRETDNIYRLSKLISESIVQNEASDSLIIRPSALLGEYAKKNSLMRILTQSAMPLSLSAESTFNYILHSDISSFIEQALKDDLKGIYNLAAISPITLGEVANLFNKKITFGNYTYLTANAVNTKAVKITDVFKRSSLDNIKLFIERSKLVMT